MRRNRFEIIAEILRVAKNGAKKTHIMYQCNLSHGMTNNFVAHLLETDLLRKGSSFRTTEKGLQFLRAYKILKHLLNEKNDRIAMG